MHMTPAHLSTICPSRVSQKSAEEVQPHESCSLGDNQEQVQQLLDNFDEGEERPGLVQNCGELRLMRAINQVLGCNSRSCSMGCMYSMDELIPAGYLLVMEEQSNAWFKMQLSAGSQSVPLWHAAFMALLQESLDEEARGVLFSDAYHVFAGAGSRTPGVPLHCRRFVYLPSEVLEDASLLLHWLPISPDQLLLIDHDHQAAAYVTVVVGFETQSAE